MGPLQGLPFGKTRSFSSGVILAWVARSKSLLGHEGASSPEVMGLQEDPGGRV